LPLTLVEIKLLFNIKKKQKEEKYRDGENTYEITNSPSIGESSSGLATTVVNPIAGIVRFG